MTARRLWLATLLVLVPAFAPAAEKDLYGDPLPEGAKARIGTARLRTQAYSTPLLSPDGKALFVTGPGGLSRVDPATGAALGKVPVTFFGTPSGFSADGKRVAAGAADGVLFLWNGDDAQVLRKMEPPTPAPDGR